MSQPKQFQFTPVHDQEFRSTTVNLDGKAFERCIFRSCIIEIGASAPFRIDETVDAYDCQWTFVGAARLTIDILVALRGAPGMEQVVEQVIAQIRGQGISAQRPNLSA